MSLCIVTFTLYPSLLVYFLARHSYISFHFQWFFCLVYIYSTTKIYTVSHRFSLDPMPQQPLSHTTEVKSQWTGYTDSRVWQTTCVLWCNTDVNIDPASSQVFQKFNLYLKTLKIQRLLQWETAAVLKYPGLSLTLVGFVWRHVIIAEIHKAMNIVSLSLLFSNFHTCKQPHIGTCTQDAQAHLMKTKLPSIRWGTHRQ